MRYLKKAGAFVGVYVGVFALLAALDLSGVWHIALAPQFLAPATMGFAAATQVGNEEKKEG